MVAAIHKEGKVMGDMVVDAGGGHFTRSPTNQQLALAFILYQDEEMGCVDLLTSQIIRLPILVLQVQRFRHNLK